MRRSQQPSRPGWIDAGAWADMRSSSNAPDSDAYLAVMPPLWLWPSPIAPDPVYPDTPVKPDPPASKAPEDPEDPDTGIDDSGPGNTDDGDWDSGGWDSGGWDSGGDSGGGSGDTGEGQIEIEYIHGCGEATYDEAGNVTGINGDCEDEGGVGTPIGDDSTTSEDGFYDPRGSGDPCGPYGVRC